LVGERGDQLDLLVGEGSDFSPPHVDNSHEDLVPEHGHTQQGAVAAHPLDVSQVVFRISQDIGDMNNFSVAGRRWNRRPGGVGSVAGNL
jgi:hypothetical protein